MVKTLDDRGRPSNFRAPLSHARGTAERSRSPIAQSMNIAESAGQIAQSSFKVFAIQNSNAEHF